MLTGEQGVQVNLRRGVRVHMHRGAGCTHKWVGNPCVQVGSVLAAGDLSPRPGPAMATDWYWAADWGLGTSDLEQYVLR